MKRLKLSHWIMLGMVLGVIVGYLCNQYSRDDATAKAIASNFNVVTGIFLRLIKMIIAPLVFATLVSGVSSMDGAKTIGRIGGKTISWFVIASLISLAIGLVFVNLAEPGAHLHMPLPPADATTNLQTSALNFKEFLTHMFPSSVIEAMAGNQIMQILVFSLFFGMALGKVPGAPGEFLKQAVDGLMDVMLRATNAVMLFAPVGIFTAIAAAVTAQGPGIVITYGKLIGWFYVALFALWAALYVAGRLVLGRRMNELLKYIREPMMIAFSTASSEAAYPKLTEVLQQFGVRKRLVGFVLPLGYSFNLDGSMVYQAFAAIFIAQAFGVHMPIGTQITMLLILMVSSKGMAAVPRGSLVVVAAILPMFHLPEAGLLLVMGIDQVLDMGRTATNVVGNSIATAVVAKWEGELAPAGTKEGEEFALALGDGAEPDSDYSSARSA
ncbi:dicarboxylate/amino acid:cation symporter [Burkholderia sp. Ax-1719]|uniref:dicarboxylate/amino acid:cation symporter n=1 Tax=Burkholderia sp. Ax-1719 TaxID=2608334 RepID=UPI00141EDB90|nr:dicarboxylate/amino acid:cation symporter [Burkholderia sp. Ax-1719]NIE63164.1 dicarboxylate/amino acid:cation symporter [Burkholderia sp. Ax-1719]